MNQLVYWRPDNDTITVILTATGGTTIIIIIAAIAYYIGKTFSPAHRSKLPPPPPEMEMSNTSCSHYGESTGHASTGLYNPVS